jgi:hypothetical protein
MGRRCADLALCLLQRQHQRVQSRPDLHAMFEKVGRLKGRLDAVVRPEREAYFDAGTFIKSSARVETVTMVPRSDTSKHLG